MTASPQGEGTTARLAARRTLTRAVTAALLWAVLGALLVTALYQWPARHAVAVGGYDAAYIQGFHAPELPPAITLAGSNGTARWSQATAAFLFPQTGLPGSVTLHLKAPTAVELVLLLNGTTELTRVRVDTAWTTLTVPVTTGWLKASDFFIEVRTTPPTTLPDGREVGVLVDEAVYTVGPGPVLPYPTQVAYGAVVGVLLWALLARRGGRVVGAALLGYGLLWLLFYRLQPPLYPYPLRALPLWAVGGLGALLLLRDGSRFAARWPLLLKAAAPLAIVAGWTAQTLLAAQSHVTLSRPGVENDFRVFATRVTLPEVFSADGFYNLGYPLLLWLVRPLYDGNAFVAGRLVAALSGAVFLAASYWLARSLLPVGPALVALLVLALSGLVAQYGLYVGSDMPFAACVALSVAALVAGMRHKTTGRTHHSNGAGLYVRGPLVGAHKGHPYIPQIYGGAPLVWFVLAGICGGLAFLMRHLGLVLLLWGLLVLLVTRRWPPALAFALGFLLAMAPQVTINVIQTGQPLYNQQAKNSWLAVYGGTDWGRWEEAPNTIGLAEVVLRDPVRWLTNWWRNIVAYLGSGAEDTSEFGRALQLRLLGFPANWLALGGMLAWVVATADRRPTRTIGDSQRSAVNGALLLLVALYVAAVSTAFALQRFFLPLAPLYAIAAAWAVWRLTGGGRALLGVTLVLGVVLWGGFAAGTRYVLENQPAEESALVLAVEAATPSGSRLAARVSSRVPVAKYSAIADRMVDWPVGADLQHPITATDLAEAQAAGARYLLWDEATGPPPLTDPARARLVTTGRYTVYRMFP